MKEEDKERFKKMFLGNIIPCTHEEITAWLNLAKDNKNNNDGLVKNAIYKLEVRKEEVGEEHEELFLSLISYLTTIVEKKGKDYIKELGSVFSNVKDLFKNVFRGEVDEEGDLNDNIDIINALIKLTIIMEDVGFLNYLKEEDYSFNEDFGNGENALHLAAKCKNPEIMNILLDALEEGNNLPKAFVEKDTRGYTPLATAVLHGNLEAVKVLLDQNSKAKESAEQRSFDAFYSETHRDEGVFDLAAISDNARLINFLISYSEKHDIDITDILKNSEQRDSALDIAIRYENTTAALSYLNFLKGKIKEKLDLSKYLSTVSLDKLAKTNDLHEILKCALELDNKLVSYKNSNGDSLLHLAVDSFNEQGVQILLEQGASINERNGEKFSVPTKLFNAVTHQIRIEDKIKANIEKIFLSLLHSKMFENADHSFNIGRLELFLKHDLTSNGQPSVLLNPFTTYLNSLAKKFDDAQSEITYYESNLVKALFIYKVRSQEPILQQQANGLAEEFIVKEENQIFKLIGGIFEQAMTISQNFTQALETLAKTRIEYLNSANNNISVEAEAEIKTLNDALETWNQKKASEMHFFEGPGFKEGQDPVEKYSDSSSFAEKPQEEKDMMGESAHHKYSDF